MLYKYPSTPHLPFSPNVKNDDTLITTLNHLVGEIVVTEKLDGENTSLYRDHYHARSMDSRHHVSRDWVKSFWGSLAYKIPEGWRICGENVYAEHSIAYEDLESYFYGFSVWDDRNVALSWDETLMFFEDVGIVPVPVLYRGHFDLAVLRKLGEQMSTDEHEGFVVRRTEEVPYDEFHLKFAKWVRKNHVQTDQHWLQKPVVPNKLKK